MAKDNKGTSIDHNSGVVAGEIGTLVYNSTTSYIRASVISNILKLMIDDKVLDSDNTNLNTYSINEKIQYNNVVKYKELIEEYYSFGNVCEQTIDKLDNCKPGSKKTIFRSVNVKYKLFKGEYLTLAGKSAIEIDVIRENADHIIDKIKDYYLELAKQTDTLNKYPYEEVELNMLAFIVYCFVECKILEKPPLEIKI